MRHEMGSLVVKLNKWIILPWKLVSIIISRSAAPKLALVPASRHNRVVN